MKPKTNLEKLKEEILIIDDERLSYYFKTHNKAILMDKNNLETESDDNEWVLVKLDQLLKKGLK